MYCKKCGTFVEKDRDICPNCFAYIDKSENQPAYRQSYQPKKDMSTNCFWFGVLSFLI